ncbi:MBOAT family O-acyltransferase [Clostridium sp. UBA1353]|uniref:MBOAT family O-acyltransferase n=1 Tax=Clostridium sp. UBA1353 TaxID=1946347 RepID=UPI003217F453
MVFTSVIFIFIFLPGIITAYFLFPEKYRNMLLLLASLFFYAWGEPKYILVMISSILINFYFGYKVHENFEHKKKKKLFLVLGILCNLSMLGFFKYGNFFINNINYIFTTLNIHESINIGKIHLPIGISFFTFQGLSYVIDVYRKEAKVQKNIFNLALYISLFPQLIAGPIVRYHDVAKEIESRQITSEKITYGIKRFILGFAKKILIANQLGIIADKIFDISQGSIPTSVAWIGILCYTMQIYYDFSGYSDMAIGLGKIFGFTFLENFNLPYVSKSIKEFWKRWHISLTNWFRDYVYISLGGNRKGKLRMYINLITIFLLSGLWHGASWNFILWGGYHGIFLILERTKFGDIIEELWSPLRRIYTMIVVMIGWVIFRLDNLNQAFQYIKSMFIFEPSNNMYYSSLYLNSKVIFILVMAILFSAPILEYIKKLIGFKIKSNPVYIACCNFVVLGLFAICLVTLAATTYNPFIYFRF